MSHATRRVDLTFDWLTAALVGLVLAFHAAGLWLADYTLSVPSESSTQSGSAEAGLALLVVIALEVAAIVLIWRGYRRLPSWAQEVAKGALAGGLYALGAVVFVDVFIPYTVGFVVVAYAIYTDSGNDFRWIVVNVLAFLLGTAAMVIGGLSFEPWLIVGLMVVTIVYDWIAVDLTAIMGDLVEMSVSVGLPNMLIIPTQLRVDYAGLKSFLSGGGSKPAGVGVVIGLGDFIVPGMLLISVFAQYRYLTWPVLGVGVGTIVAMVVLRSAIQNREGGVPALPWLNSGAIAGYIVGLALLTLPV